MNDENVMSDRKFIDEFDLLFNRKPNHPRAR